MSIRSYVQSLHNALIRKDKPKHFLEYQQEMGEVRTERMHEQDAQKGPLTATAFAERIRCMEIVSEIFNMERNGELDFLGEPLDTLSYMSEKDRREYRMDIVEDQILELIGRVYRGE
jgi:hypothetical protein